MAQQKKVEAWVKRIDENAFQYLFRNEETNKPSYESQIYTRRSTAVIGAKRYAAKNNIKIKWLPKQR